MTQEEIKRHRVESVLKELLPEAFSSLSDERINSLAVTDVKCSKGRSNAKVYLDKSFLTKKSKVKLLDSCVKSVRIFKITVNVIVLGIGNDSKCANGQFRAKPRPA